jgi:AmmeMemoRadiSam system protein B
MPIDSSDPPRPGRIILPGQEHAIPGEAGEPAAPRLIVPPGVREESDEGLPEYPRLRPLELMVVRDGDREVVLVNDPLGVMPAPVALRLESVPLLQVLDGTISLQDLSAEIVRGSQDLRGASQVREFVAQLDKMLMLESPRFDAAYEALRASYHQLEIRPAALADYSYPADPEALRAILEGHFAEAEARRASPEAVAAAPGPRRALLAPHLDPRRSGATLAQAILDLDEPAGEPLRVVVFGTGHLLTGARYALTRKHFETPIGRIDTDTAFVDALATRLGERAYDGELAHRMEHSIEFPAIYLRHRFAGRAITIVPILCAGFAELVDEGLTARHDATLEALIAAVRDAEKAATGRTVYLAAVDFSHVGPRFGDPNLDERTIQEIEAKDRDALAAAARGDADGWFKSIADHQDSTRICGWGPTYAMLRCAEPGNGRLLHYEGSQETNGSLVTIAAMAWP